MRIVVKSKNKIEFNDTVITKILNAMSLNTGYTIEYENGFGHHIVVEDNGKKMYIILTREEADGRNAYLSQYIPTVLSQFIKDNTENKSLFVFLRDTTKKAKSSFHIDAYRTVKTLGINIINEKDLQMGDILPYKSFYEWKNAKTQRQERNTSNKSSYAIEENNVIIVYGKLFGANGKEITMTACQLAMIGKEEGKTTTFIPVKEHGTKRIGKNDKELLIHFCVNIAKDYIVVKGKETIINKSTCRDQNLFRYNLLQKYGYKKCLLCDCDIESNIIASHIHRITDIDRSNISDEEKQKQAVDANNGLWLCANHDKMFEYGIITLTINGEIIINKFELNVNQIKYVQSITYAEKIKKEFLTRAFVEYLKVHNKRVNLGV